MWTRSKTRRSSTGDYDRLRFASVALVSLSLSPALGSSNGGQAAAECRSSKKRGHDRAKGNAAGAGGREDRERGEGEGERERKRGRTANEQPGLSLSQARRVVRERQPAE